MGRRGIILAGVMALAFMGATAEAVEPGATYWHAGQRDVNDVVNHILVETTAPNRIDVHEVTFTNEQDGSSPPSSSSNLVDIWGAVRTSGSSTTCNGAGWTRTVLRRVALAQNSNLQLRFDEPLRIEGGDRMCFGFQQMRWIGGTRLHVGASGFHVPPPPPPARPETVTVTQTVTQTVAAPGTDTRPPVTGIDGPLATRARRPLFNLVSNESSSTFECRVDTGRFRECSTPFRTPLLRLGRHTLRVRATDAAGNADATPAVRSFRVLAAPRRR